ncbi:MAG: hypothetical protein M1825_005786 [Sarcosagium campestre]|nr:MAG: hypothetical protein M1825_005786 [Sarcosagium campestre]
MSKATISDFTLEKDAAVLADLGYKQELRRNFTTFQIFGVAFSIMGLLPAIASTIQYAIPAGPVGLVWGWLFATGFIFVVGLAMADLGSAMPTSGGLYWWTHYFGSPRTRNPLSFLVGYSNTLGLVSGLCGVDYGFSLMLLSIIIVARDGEWEPTNAHIYGTFLACLISHGIVASTLNKYMGRVQSFSVAVNVAVFAVNIIALPIGKRGNMRGGRNDAGYIFGHADNLTTWPAGWQFMMSWLTPIWSIGAFDSCVHMSEEAANATIAVPYGILMAIGSCWILGFILMIVISACVNPDLQTIMDSKFGQPMAQIYFDTVGKNGAIALMCILLFAQYLMGLSNIVPASRQAWAFSRDGALPFSGFFRQISSRFGYIPLRAIWGCAGCAAVLGLLTLIAPAAAQALFSLAVTGNNVAWGVPIMCRAVWGQAKFKPGPFYTGDRFSIPIAWVSIFFLMFGVILAMFPVKGPNPDPSDMNFAVVISVTVWGGSLLYYYVDARKWFRGPKTTVEMDDESDSRLPGQSLSSDAGEEGLRVKDTSAVRTRNVHLHGAEDIS